MLIKKSRALRGFSLTAAECRGPMRGLRCVNLSFSDSLSGDCDPLGAATHRRETHRVAGAALPRGAIWMANRGNGNVSNAGRPHANCERTGGAKPSTRSPMATVGWGVRSSIGPFPRRCAESRLQGTSMGLHREQRAYYEALKAAQRGTGEITGWLAWFTNAFCGACRASIVLIDEALKRARFWSEHKHVDLNGRQSKGLEPHARRGPEEIREWHDAAQVPCAQQDHVHHVQP